MDSALTSNLVSLPQGRLGHARLYVAWQDPTTRAIEPVGRLDRLCGAPADTYEFRYLRRAVTLDGFRPFLSFPDLQRTYRSSYLFPLFENRLMPRTRADYPDFVRALGLGEDADPFEVLARSEGRRQTDNIEVFPEPTLEGGAVRCLFLVHGIRHIPGAEEAVDSLAVGERLSIVPDPQNPADRWAVGLRDGGFRLLGWVPRYLTELIHRPLEVLGPSAVDVRAEHVGARNGPIHLRLLCQLHAQWPHAQVWPFAGPEVEVVSTTDG